MEAGIENKKEVVKDLHMNSKRVLYTSIQTDIGLCRKNNEDNFLFKTIINKESEDRFYAESIESVNEHWLCYAVFDGMGGIEYGEIASKIMAEECYRYLSHVDINCEYSEIDEKVKNAVDNANKRIIDVSKTHSVCGTTATILMTDGVVFKIYHLGDCRAYLFRNKQLYQITEDQTVAELKRKAGFDESQITKREHHQLTEFVGADKNCAGIRPQESDWIGLKPEDKIVICSDGLYDLCTDIRLIVESNLDERILENLIKDALINGGEDNITGILISCKEDQK